MAIYVNGKKVAGLGIQGPPGTNGTDGKSAFQIASENGYTGTEQEFNQTLGNLDELFTSVSDGKSAIAAAITDKGVDTAADATFQQMADNILAIESGGNIPTFNVTVELKGFTPNSYSILYVNSSNEYTNVDLGLGIGAGITSTSFNAFSGSLVVITATGMDSPVTLSSISSTNNKSRIIGNKYVGICIVDSDIIITIK